MMNKRGEITDMLTVGFWIFVLAVGVLAIMFGLSQLVDPLRDSILGEDNLTRAAINSFDSYISLSPAAAYLIVFFGLILGVMVSSFFVREHPIFIPIYILFAICTVIVMVALGNVWGNLTEYEGFQEILELNQATQVMNLIISNIVLITVVVFILSLMIVFAKPGSGTGGGAPV